MADAPDFTPKGKVILTDGPTSQPDLANRDNDFFGLLDLNPLKEQGLGKKGALNIVRHGDFDLAPDTVAELARLGAEIDRRRAEGRSVGLGKSFSTDVDQVEILGDILYGRNVPIAPKEITPYKPWRKTGYERFKEAIFGRRSPVLREVHQQPVSRAAKTSSWFTRAVNSAYASMVKSANTRAEFENKFGRQNIRDVLRTHYNHPGNVVSASTSRLGSISERAKKAYQDLSARAASRTSRLYDSASEQLSRAGTKISALQFPYKRFGSAAAASKLKRLSELSKKAYHNLGERVASSASSLNDSYHSASDSVSQIPYKRTIAAGIALTTAGVLYATTPLGVAVNKYGKNLNSRISSAITSMNESSEVSTLVGNPVSQSPAVSTETPSLEAMVNVPSNNAQTGATQNTVPIPNEGHINYIPTVHKVNADENLSRIVQQYRFGSSSFNAIVRQYAKDNGLQSPYKIAREDTPVRIATYDGKEIKYIDAVVFAGTDFATPLRREIRKSVRATAELNKMQNANLIFPHQKLTIEGHFSAEDRPETHAKLENRAYEAQDGSTARLSYDAGSDSLTLKAPAHSVQHNIVRGRYTPTNISGLAAMAENQISLSNNKSETSPTPAYRGDLSHDGDLFGRVGGEYTSNLGEDLSPKKYERATVFKGLFDKSKSEAKSLFKGRLFEGMRNEQDTKLGEHRKSNDDAYRDGQIFAGLREESEPAPATVYSGNLFASVGEKQTIGLGKFDSVQQSDQYVRREMFADSIEGRKTIIPQAGGLADKVKDKARGLFGRIAKLVNKEYEAPGLTPWLDRISGRQVYSK